MRAIEEIDTKEKKDIIIDQMMMSNSVYILVSSPKVGKSMLALQLSNSIVNGIPFLEYRVKSAVDNKLSKLALLFAKNPLNIPTAAWLSTSVA